MERIKPVGEYLEKLDRSELETVREELAVLLDGRAWGIVMHLMKWLETQALEDLMASETLVSVYKAQGKIGAIGELNGLVKEVVGFVNEVLNRKGVM